MAEQTKPYAATLTIDYPDRNLNRLTSFFRIFTSIPIWIILALLVGATFGTNETHEAGPRILATTAGIVILPTLLMILFRQKYRNGGSIGTLR